MPFWSSNNKEEKQAAASSEDVSGIDPKLAAAMDMVIQDYDAPLDDDDDDQFDDAALDAELKMMGWESDDDEIDLEVDSDAEPAAPVPASSKPSSSTSSHSPKAASQSSPAPSTSVSSSNNQSTPVPKPATTSQKPSSPPQPPKREKPQPQKVQQQQQQQPQPQTKKAQQPPNTASGDSIDEKIKALKLQVAQLSRNGEKERAKVLLLAVRKIEAQREAQKQQQQQGGGDRSAIEQTPKQKVPVQPRPAKAVVERAQPAPAQAQDEEYDEEEIAENIRLLLATAMHHKQAGDLAKARESFQLAKQLQDLLKQKQAGQAQQTPKTPTQRSAAAPATRRPSRPTPPARSAAQQTQSPSSPARKTSATNPAIGDNQLILTIVCARFLQPPPKFSTLDTFVTGEWNEEQFSTSVVKSSLDPEYSFTKTLYLIRDSKSTIRTFQRKKIPFELFYRKGFFAGDEVLLRGALPLSPLLHSNSVSMELDLFSPESSRKPTGSKLVVEAAMRRPLLEGQDPPPSPHTPGSATQSPAKQSPSPSHRRPSQPKTQAVSFFNDALESVDRLESFDAMNWELEYLAKLEADPRVGEAAMERSFAIEERKEELQGRVASGDLSLSEYVKLITKQLTVERQVATKAKQMGDPGKHILLRALNRMKQIKQEIESAPSSE